MLFSLKIFICIVVAVAISVATGGFLLISSNFADARNQEMSFALDEQLSLQYMLESAIVTQEVQEQQVTDDVMKNAAQNIVSSMQMSGQASKTMLIYDNNGNQIYPQANKKAAYIKELASLPPGQVLSFIQRDGNTYTLSVTGSFTYGSTKNYVCYEQDISKIFVQRNAQVRLFLLYQGINILMSALLAFLISWLLTRSVRRLAQTTHRIAGGDYGQRADIRSSDEIGQLAHSFNLMAESVEDKINQLEKESRIKDDFVANFTHELKTPMTSIVGYADMLRSRQLDPTTTFKAASYIFSEATRLEALSLKLLHLIMLEQQTFSFVPTSCVALLGYVVRVATPAYQRDGIAIHVEAQTGFIQIEPDLMKTLLINIVDNARKASSTGSRVELRGYQDGEHYTFSVIDHGRGIPQEELGKITEAFYMVDKSRSRSQHGVGLGLAIASSIATLHHTTLQFHSRVDEGTNVSIKLPTCQAPESEYEN